MDWNNELLNSAIWILTAYSITVVVSGLAICGLARHTVWGRQFWDLTAGYFSPRHQWRPLLALAFILFLTLFAVRIDVLFSIWYNNMYTSLQQLNEAGFWFAMWLFAVLAAVHVIRSLIEFYVQQAFTIDWRVWLNDKLLDRWLDRQAYYRTQYLDKPIDNPDQRIQQDVTTFVTMSLTLANGVVNALVSTFAFTLILWNLSGPLGVLGFEVPRALVFLVFLYVIVATVFAVRIGRPLILLNFLSERFNADYRYALVRIREYSESVAFYAGEIVEGALLRSRFAQIISNAWAIIHRSLKFLGFNFSVTQAAVVFPFIIQAERFFTKQISLGDLIQTSQSFGRLQDNLSFFRNAYDNFATYRATLERLTGFTIAIHKAHALPEPRVQARGSRIALEHLTVSTPIGQVLIKDLTLEVLAGGPLLIRGPSGSGKTTLLRSIAGLWPYCEGDIVRPKNGALFLSQKPYLPLGTLRDALYYPQAVPQTDGALPGSRPARIGSGRSAATAGMSATAPISSLDSFDGLLAAVPINSLDSSPGLLAATPILPSLNLAIGKSPSHAQSLGLADSRAHNVLKQVQLGHLIDRLDEADDWGRILSLGEQQRLAFGRLILAKPDAAFLDEATSAMDEGLEDAMYRLTREYLPNTILVSVGHRSTLLAHHPRQLTLKGNGEWELSGK